MAQYIIFLCPDHGDNDMEKLFVASFASRQQLVTYLKKHTVLRQAWVCYRPAPYHLLLALTTHAEVGFGIVNNAANEKYFRVFHATKGVVVKGTDLVWRPGPEENGAPPSDWRDAALDAWATSEDE